ncbi:hypothetical protein [Laspinema olomoucense]|uniref:hypothetical protein n=1 Tax=Laspinema olomoucense TaxID=3231600 RepID=UPI0021BB7296|nr:hypothetical protein [Laspinema sp. D3c]
MRDYDGVAQLSGVALCWSRLSAAQDNYDCIGLSPSIHNENVPTSGQPRDIGSHWTTLQSAPTIKDAIATNRMCSS